MVDRVIAALTQLRALDAAPLSQGLHPRNARLCLDAALDAITASALRAELSTKGSRPDSVTVVAAAGVFTSPIEWVAILAAAGCRVHIKAPTEAPALCLALAKAMQAQALPVTADTKRALGTPDAVVGFGSDASMATIRDATPGSRHSLYGHRFSIAVVTCDPKAAAQALARDAAMYDTRGCMAPTAVLTTGDPKVLAAHLAQAMAHAQQAIPRGQVDPALGPEWRRRVGLARIRGMCLEGEGWAVPVLDAADFQPVALPRMLPIHGIQSAPEIDALLAPWHHQLSTCGTDDAQLTPRGTLRRVALGQMQTPALPRDHDGRPMLGSILG